MYSRIIFLFTSFLLYYIWKMLIWIYKMFFFDFGRLGVWGWGRGLGRFIVIGCISVNGRVVRVRLSLLWLFFV